MMKTLKALSALLTYPTAELTAAVPDIRSVLHGEGVLASEALPALEPLLSSLASEDLYDLQERYVILFDRTRTCRCTSLSMSRREPRPRSAMVDLKSVYEAAGFEISSTELPDYVPLFLEYCSLLPEAEARQMLSEPAHVLTALGERLRKKDSAYAAVFEALVSIAASKPSAEAFEALVPEQDIDPNDLKALDAVWEEEEVRFGPGAAVADCGVDSLAAKIARRAVPPQASKFRLRAILVLSSTTSQPAPEVRSS
jgi:nitrate reductase delta subunit